MKKVCTKCGEDKPLSEFYNGSTKYKGKSYLTKRQPCKKCYCQKTVQKLRSIPLYQTWTSMRQRCLNPNNGRYYKYGGRGIGICEEWNDFKIFQKDCLARGWQPGLSVDRIDNDRGYFPDNVQFLPLVENQRKDNLGENHYMFGKHHTLETRQKMSVAQKDRVLSEETKEKIRKGIKEVWRQRKYGLPALCNLSTTLSPSLPN